jgi:hypothetical protein
MSLRDRCDEAIPIAQGFVSPRQARSQDATYSHAAPRVAIRRASPERSGLSVSRRHSPPGRSPPKKPVRPADVPAPGPDQHHGGGRLRMDPPHAPRPSRETARRGAAATAWPTWSWPMQPSHRIPLLGGEVPEHYGAKAAFLTSIDPCTDPRGVAEMPFERCTNSSSSRSNAGR